MNTSLCWEVGASREAWELCAQPPRPYCATRPSPCAQGSKMQKPKASECGGRKGLLTEGASREDGGPNSSSNPS